MCLESPNTTILLTRQAVLVGNAEDGGLLNVPVAGGRVVIMPTGIMYLATTATGFIPAHAVMATVL